MGGGQEPGLAGLSGLAGLAGEAGLAGLAGDCGDIGEAGLAGDCGDTGLAGEAGLSGLAGLAGDWAETGEAGLAGLFGLAGEAALAAEATDTGEAALAGLAAEAWASRAGGWAVVVVVVGRCGDGADTWPIEAAEASDVDVVGNTIGADSLGTLASWFNTTLSVVIDPRSGAASTNPPTVTPASVPTAAATFQLRGFLAFMRESFRRIDPLVDLCGL